MEHRRVEINDHPYQWVDSQMWEARVVGGAGPGRLFDTFEEALNWVQCKPQFALIRVECVRAYKIRSEAQVPETAVVDGAQEPQQQDHTNHDVDHRLDDRRDSGDRRDTP